MATVLREAPAGYTMALDKDVEIKLSDGAVLRADVYRPEKAGKYPAIMTYGPYGKDSHISQFMGEGWDALKKRHPEIVSKSTAKHMVFERPDPETWVPHGYAVIHVDCRGAGRSPGKLDVNSPQEFKDFKEAIEWAGVQPWCNGKVGLTGISYHAAGQWRVASLKPPHLKALCPWMGTYDFFRDRTRQDGIFGSGFVKRWWTRSVLRNQHGNPESPYHDIYTGGRTTGELALSSAELAANRADYVGEILAHPLNDSFYQERTPDLAKIDQPILVVANWGGLALHLRGTIGGYMGVSSRDKWLKIQSGSYIHTYFQPQNVALQKRFFDRYLKDADNGWEKEPKVELSIRGPGDTVKRLAKAAAWPVPETQWMRFYLDASRRMLEMGPPGAEANISYPALSEGATFTTPPVAHDTEIAGPAKVKLFVSSGTEDMDIFATLCAWDPQGKEMTFRTGGEPKSPASQGWLRASQRKLDPERSTEYAPFHPHDERQPLKPGEIYEIDVEIWPFSLFLPAGSRLSLTIQGKDFERSGETGPTKGVGWMYHDDPTDRPAAIFGGTHALYAGGRNLAYLLLPVLPAR